MKASKLRSIIKEEIVNALREAPEMTVEEAFEDVSLTIDDALKIQKFRHDKIVYLSEALKICKNFLHERTDFYGEPDEEKYEPDQDIAFDAYHDGDTDDRGNRIDRD